MLDSTNTFMYVGASQLLALTMLYLVLISSESADSIKHSAKDTLVRLRDAVGAHDATTKFNVTRSRLWDCAKRAFSRVSYNPYAIMSVKFMDDVGISEGAVDQGGPRREFLQLLVEHLATNSKLFAGSSNSKTLAANSNGK